MKPNRRSDESEEREMARQPNIELRLLSGSFLAATLGGRAYPLASSDLYLHPDRVGSARKR
jgi:hypothetical protein